MSGIYIPMEMPTRCGRCDMRIPAYDDGVFDHYECCITAATIDNLGEKMEDCPLLPVPDHGRLIDADVICEECRRVAGEYDGIYPDCTYCPVHLAPAIIPADPAKEGE